MELVTVFDLSLFTFGVTFSLIAYLTIYFVLNGARNFLDRLNG